MFGFLKKKLGEAISRFTDKAKAAKEEKTGHDEELPPKKAEAAKAKQPEKTAEKLKTEQIKIEEPEKAEAGEAKKAAAAVAKEKAPERAKAGPEKPEQYAGEEFQGTAIAAEPKKKGLFGRITGAVTTAKISAEKFEELFWELEVTLLENNVAVEVIGKIREGLKESLVEKPLQRGKIEEAIKNALRESIGQLFISGYDFKEKIKQAVAVKKPAKIMFVGINGSGKTTTIAKMAKMLQDSKLKVAIAASDTFRAAAIHQLQEHADRLGIKLIKHGYGADPAAVAFDAVKYAEAHGIDAVMIDTAGRLHSNVNLIAELKKISRVAKPDFKIFVGESITGNDCTEQARSFNEAIGIDGIILSKADVDERGGAAISVSYVTGKPIFYIGTGQGYDDLKPFSADEVIESLGLA